MRKLFSMVGKIFFSYSVNKSFFVLLIVPSNWYVRFMPQTTKVCHQKLKCQQEQRQRQEELGRGLLQCPPPVPVTVAWKREFCTVCSPGFCPCCSWRLSVKVSLQLLFRLRVLILRFLIIFRDFFSGNPKVVLTAFDTALVFI